MKKHPTFQERSIEGRMEGGGQRATSHSHPDFFLQYTFFLNTRRPIQIIMIFDGASPPPDFFFFYFYLVHIKIYREKLRY